MADSNPCPCGGRFDGDTCSTCKIVSGVLSTLPFTDSQRKAVEFGCGPLAILAVAGSGKTHALTARLARLLEKGVDPSRIAAVTFTKKAAGEMAERVASLVEESIASKLQVSTFHSLCFRIVREAGRGRRGIVKDWEAKKFVADALKTRGIDYEPGPVLSAISWLKNCLDDPRAWTEADRRDGSTKGIPNWIVAPVFEAYEAAKLQKNLLDFDDMLTIAVDVMRRGGSSYRARYEWVLVDEFQDTNVAQFEFLRLLCPPKNRPNLTVVGDDDQSIYAFRAAKPEFLINFEEAFPGATVVRMEQNFRCRGEILDHANALIVRNEVRVEKMLRVGTEAQTTAEGVLAAFVAADEDEEALRVAETIIASHEAGVAWKETALLYRTNAQSRALEDAMIKGRIPYQILGGMGFYGRKEVRDLVAYARLLANRGDDDAFRRVFNTPTRYLGKAAIKAVEEQAAATKTSLWVASAALKKWPKGFMADRFADFRRDVDRGYAGDPGDALKTLAGVLGFRDYLTGENGGDADDSRWENCEALFSAASNFDTLGDFVFYAKEASKPKQTEANRDAVTLLTLHRSKGLEWPTVFVVGVSAGVLPHAMAEDVAEERRLFYVGLTRSRVNLTVSSTLTYNRKPGGVSVFVGEAGLNSTVRSPAGEGTAEPRSPEGTLTPYDGSERRVETVPTRWRRRENDVQAKVDNVIGATLPALLESAGKSFEEWTTEGDPATVDFSQTPASGMCDLCPGSEPHPCHKNPPPKEEPMATIKFARFTEPEKVAVEAIIRRALAVYAKLEMKAPDATEIRMDLAAVHAHTPLRLDELAEAPDSDFVHDIGGIQSYISRETGLLGSCFVPRYAV